MQETKKCKYCKSEIDKKAKVCPHCKKKQNGIMKFIIIGIVVIGIIGALTSEGEDEQKHVETSSGTGSNNNSDVVEKPTVTPTAIPEKTTFAIGETAELKDVQVTLVSVTESEGGDFNKPTDGKIFALCEFEIENNSSKDIAVSSIISFEAYCDDYAITQSISALLVSDKNQLDGSVAAGKKMNGVIGYEIPADWSELEIKFTPDFWSRKDIVFVATK